MRRSITAAFLAMLTCQSFGITVTIGSNYSPSCIYANGSMYATVDGGIPPYTYAWSNGATEQYVYDVAAGSYSVTVTDANFDTAMDTYVLTSVPVWGSGNFVPDCVDPSLGLGPEYRLFAHATSPFPFVGPMGIVPFTIGDGYTHVILDASNGGGFAYLTPPGQWPQPGQVLEIPFTDGSGCAGVLEAQVPATPDFPSVQLLSVQGSCSGGANGSIEVYVGTTPNSWLFNLELIHNGNSFGMLSNGSFGPFQATVTRHDLPPGDYLLLSSSVAPNEILQELMDDYFDAQNSTCKDTLEFTIPDLGYTCGTIEGYAFMDDDQNCVRNGAEPRFPQSVLEIQPGNLFTMTDLNGDYWAQLPYGSYTIEQQSPLVVEHCTGAPIPFEIAMATPEVTKLLPDTGLVDRDVSITIGNSPARPGFQITYVARVRNLTPGSVSGVTASVTFEPTLGFISAAPTPASVVGNLVTWDLGTIASFGAKTARLILQVPPDVNLIGTDLLTSATVSVSQTEPDLSNNAFSNITTVTGSYDPNDKQVFTESNNDGLFLINEDEWLDYTIRFQNTGTDTAFFVVITDTLPNTVDPASFIAGAASHGYRVAMSGQGIVRFSFPNILLPDSNVNELGSHGFVTFRIKPIEPVLPGTTTENIANIYFDYNPPVITEPSVLVAEFSTTVQELALEHMRLQPNPVRDQLLVSVDQGSIERIRIVSMDGREVLSRSERGSSIVIAVDRFADGNYVMELTLSNGAMLRERFSKH